MQFSGYELLRMRLPGTGVKLAMAAAHFHGFGVARQGPWVTSVNKLENGTLWRMCPLTLARRHARDRASEVSKHQGLRETSEVAELALLKPL
jgi:hypothetical protein